MPLVLKRHTYNFFALAGRDTEQLPLSSAKTCAGTEIEIFRGLADMISVGTQPMLIAQGMRGARCWRG